MTEPPLSFSDSLGINGKWTDMGMEGRLAQSGRQASIMVQVVVAGRLGSHPFLNLEQVMKCPI